MPGYRILIVDDQRDVRRVLRAGIESLGPEFKVTDVPSGEEAILVISRQPVDLLVSDIRLPGISGLELKERATVRNPELRYILITGMTDPKVHAQMANANVDAFFLKPVPMGEFLDAVQFCLGIGPAGAEVEAQAPQVVSAPPASPVPVFMPVGAPAEAAAPPEEKASAPAPESGGLSVRLVSLRQELGAHCVALLDESGQFTAIAGEFPEGFNESGLVEAAIDAFGSASRLSALLGQAPPSNLMVHNGPAQDVFLMHVGAALGLMGLAPAAVWDAERLGFVFQVIRSAVQDILAALKAMGMDVGEPAAPPEPQPEPEVEAEPVDESFLASLDLLFGGQGQPPRVENADSFWDLAVSDKNDQVERSDVITFDQARQLGLAPDEK